MNGKFLKSLFVALMAMFCYMNVHAHDFEVDGIFYNIIGNDEVSVTYKGESGSVYEHEYSGDVVIPETVTYEGKTYKVTTLGRYAFYLNYLMTSISIPNSVTRIEENALEYCRGLKSLTIPNSVTHIKDYAFVFCNKLTEVTLSNNIDSLGIYPFQDCENLERITIPTCLTSIVWGMFYGCSKLDEVVIPSSITMIEKYAFNSCDSLKTIVVSENVTEIGTFAFYRCYALASMYMLAKNPPTIEENTFSKDSYDKATIYVPNGSLFAYRNDPVWNKFANIQEFDATGIQDVKTNPIVIKVTSDGISLPDSEGEIITIYTVDGTLVRKAAAYAGGEIPLNKGVYLVRIGNYTVKINI